MKKRYICFISIILLLIIIFVVSKNKPNNYSIEYDKDGYVITEEYDKDKEIYIFKLIKDEYIFYYAYKHDYTSDRKLVSKINESQNDDTICLSIKYFDTNSETICSDTKEYSIDSLEETDESKEREVSFTYEDVKVYDKSYNYYEWNGYGFTNLNNKKEYNVLEKENYNNELCYVMDNYIVFANYDEKNEYSILYVFNANTNKFSKIKLSTKISSNSYYQGDVDGLIYLFDRKNSVQYTIDPVKNKINKVSDSEGASYYDGVFASKPLKEFKYKDLIFTNNDIKNYSIINNVLYMNYYNSNDKIKIYTKANYILKSDNDEVIFLSDNTIYSYQQGKGINKLAYSLQWEFHYDSQIFIF